MQTIIWQGGHKPSICLKKKERKTHTENLPTKHNKRRDGCTTIFTDEAIWGLEGGSVWEQRWLQGGPELEAVASKGWVCVGRHAILSSFVGVSFFHNEILKHGHCQSSGICSLIWVSLRAGIISSPFLQMKNIPLLPGSLRAGNTEEVSAQLPGRGTGALTTRSPKS